MITRTLENSLALLYGLQYPLWNTMLVIHLSLVCPLVLCEPEVRNTANVNNTNIEDLLIEANNSSSLDTNVTLKDVVSQMRSLHNQILVDRQQTREEFIRVLDGKQHGVFHREDRGRTVSYRKQVRQVMAYLRTLQLDIRQLNYETVFLRRRFEFSLNETKTGWNGRFENVLASLSNLSETLDIVTSRVVALEGGVTTVGIALPTIGML